jgi:tRNA (cytidine/uridine-2'-O-)-methyltransferase
LFNIVLVSPKIPQNVGNIGRTCVALRANLHIIKPIPFEISDKQVKRAGLDYWPHLQLSIWDTLEEFLSSHPVGDRHFFATTKSERVYFDVDFLPDDFFYFGSEDAGLPMELMGQRTDGMITLPMSGEMRSINLSNAVAVVAYEAVRQNFRSFYE